MTKDQSELDPERRRLAEDEAREANWKRWGPYLSERQWGTVREDYSGNGETWDSFPREQARSRAYRWGEDGLLGWCDRQCRLCFSVSLWNGADSILKERLFGLTNHEGNHGEDVKELYYYLDSTPTHAYAKSLYQYPQSAFPYDELIAENARRDRSEPEFEIADTGVFDDGRYFDVYTEYAKAAPEDLRIRITVRNRGPEEATIHVLPTLWFRNTWIWGCRHEGCTLKPRIEAAGDHAVTTSHETLGEHCWIAGPADDGTEGELWFTENETNTEKLFEKENYTPHVKDAFHRRLVEGEASATCPEGRGTKVAAVYALVVPPGGRREIRLRLVDGVARVAEGTGEDFDAVFEAREAEANTFYAGVVPATANDGERAVMRQAYAGLLWSKQFYHYIVEDWLDGDPNQPPPPEGRDDVRNGDWRHLFNRDLVSMPDKWEYPWYAAWDLAFHMIPFAEIDPAFAKHQLLLFLREWYMHPNGQIPAYEFNFSDVNPPVHAWAVWRVYKLDARDGGGDVTFLARCFQKLLMNFTWWVNRKDDEGKNLFSGGFLGLDNIGVFDRSQPLPSGGELEQADATAWMAFYCTTMLSIAFELARHDRAYEDMASKFFEHFVNIADALNHYEKVGLWDEDDGFYYDGLRSGENFVPLKVRSLVGLLPLIAVEVFEGEGLEELTEFRKRALWFLENRSDLRKYVTLMEEESGEGENKSRRVILAMCSRPRLERLLGYLFDESEFLAPYGIRSLSRYHEAHPYEFHVDGETHRVAYEPAESQTWMFGGNSNWRGPVWLPVNYLLIESLERYHYFYGESFQVEFPKGSGEQRNLLEMSREIGDRLMNLFLPLADGERPCHRGDAFLAKHEEPTERILFYEYFDPDTGRGLGASHQTGWTALVNRLIRKKHRGPGVRRPESA